MSESLGIVAAIFAGAAVTTATGASDVLAAAALVGLVTGIAAAIYAAKNKATLTAAQDALALAREEGQSWRGEYEAGKVRAERLAESLRETEAARAAAEARTDIRKIENLITSQHQEMALILSAIKDSLHATTTAVEFLAKQQHDAT